MMGPSFNFRMLVRSSLGSLHVVTLPSSLGVYEHYCDAFSWTDTLTQLLNLTKPLQVIKHHTAGMELVKLDRVSLCYQLHRKPEPLKNRKTCFL